MIITVKNIEFRDITLLLFVYETEEREKGNPLRPLIHLCRCATG